MKKLNLLTLLLAIFAIGFMSSCTDDSEKPAPTITVKDSDGFIGTPTATAGSAYAGGSIGWIVEFKADEKVKTIDVKKAGTSLSGYPRTIAAKPTAVTDTILDDVAANATGTIAYVISVTDDNGKTTSINFTLTVVTAKSWTNAILFGQGTQAGDGPSGAVIGSFYASSTGTVYNTSGAAGAVASVDISYIGVDGPSALDGVHFISPDKRSVAGGTNLAGATATKFGPTSGNIAFNTATAQDIADETAPTADNVVLSIGSTYVFKNAAGKQGLIRVTSIDKPGAVPTNARSYVTFDVKVLN